ncbi:hypothetical protein [Leptolyngbya phage Lsp-JY17]
MNCIALTLSVLLCRQVSPVGVLTATIELYEPLPQTTLTLDECSSRSEGFTLRPDSECQELLTTLDNTSEVAYGNTTKQ